MTATEPPDPTVRATTDTDPDQRRDGSLTRRDVLSGLGALGLAGVGTVTGRASADDRTAAGTTTSGATTDRTKPGNAAFPDPAELEAFVDDLLAERVGETVPGATVAVVEGDRTVLTKGYGYADAEARTPVRADETAFRIGSVGKLVTWTAVMQGVERGTLDLDADVREYLGDSAVDLLDGDPITLRHLGTHTAGFESALDPGVVDDPGDVSSVETALVERRPDRVRPPGEAVGYSNYGATLAGHVVAQAHGTTFDEYVHDEILDPLGMDHTTFAQPVPDDHPGHLAAPHAGDGDGFAVQDPVYLDFRPAGSTAATATDVATFMRAHLGGGTVDGTELLGADAAEEMHGLQFERHPAVNNWRYGFYEHGPPGADLVGHSGGTVYYASFLLLAPDRDAGVFVNYNVRNDDRPVDVVDAIVDEYDLRPEVPAPDPTTGPGVVERAERVAGEYGGTLYPESGPLAAMDLADRKTVEATGDGRIRLGTLGGRREWVEVAPYVYRAVDGTDVAAFEVENGRVAALHLNSQPQGSFVPVEQFGDRQLVSIGVLGGALLGFAGSLLGRAGCGARRRWTRFRSDAGSGGQPADDSTEGSE